MKTLLTVAAVSTAVALAFTAAAPAKAADWSGSHIGLQLSFGTVADDYDTPARAVGIQAGHDWQTGNWVVGIGADATTVTGPKSFDDFDSLSRLKVRGGYDFGNTLVYVSAGASYATHDDLGSDWGYFGGVGFERRVNDNWSITGEIAQHRFDDFAGTGEMTPTVASVGFNYRF